MTSLDTLPALAVRQPWAWAIIHAGKDIENRGPVAIRKGNMRPRRIAIHASATMTRAEYQSAWETMAGIGVECLEPCDLSYGGIIGSVDVVAIVTKHDSPWFFGPRGLVLANPEPCAFVPAKGALGFFAWRPSDPRDLPPLPKWMGRRMTCAEVVEAEKQERLI